jgi:hypothetical protein
LRWGERGKKKRKRRTTMKVKTNIKAGRLAANHNETLTQDSAQGLKVKTSLKAGRLASNHNETMVGGNKLGR